MPIPPAGNAASVSCTYTVAYGFGGFSSRCPRARCRGRARRSPVKFVLTDAAGHPIAASTAAALATAGKVKAMLAGPAISPQSAPCAWNSTDRLFQCNLKTPSGLRTGTANPYTITASEDLGSGLVIAPAVGAAVNAETVYFK